MQYLETFEATFKPKRLDDLTPEAKSLIGRMILWCVAWEIEEGEYKGQWALIPHELLPVPLGWVPECDVEDRNNKLQLKIN